MASRTAVSSAISAEASVSLGSVTSRDGTTIGYRQLGRGPGLVILHGSAETSLSHIQLAQALADTYTVYLPDRRGRGLSGPYSKNHSLQTDVEDIDALLTKTGAHYVLGISSGAVIFLKAMLSLPAIHKAVIFEPPIAFNGSLSLDFISRFDQEIAQGKITDALVTGMLGAQMGPPIFQKMPRWLLRLMTNMMIKSQQKNAKAGDVTMADLAPTLHYDFAIAYEIISAVDSLHQIQAEVLLLGADQSPAYLKTSVRELEKIIPSAQRVELAGAGHSVTGNADQWGQPERVAQELRRFFG